MRETHAFIGSEEWLVALWDPTNFTITWSFLFPLFQKDSHSLLDNYSGNVFSFFCTSQGSLILRYIYLFFDIISYFPIKRSHASSALYTANLTKLLHCIRLPYWAWMLLFCILIVTIALILVFWITQKKTLRNKNIHMEFKDLLASKGSRQEESMKCRPQLAMTILILAALYFMSLWFMLEETWFWKQYCPHILWSVPWSMLLPPLFKSMLLIDEEEGSSSLKEGLKCSLVRYIISLSSLWCLYNFQLISPFHVCFDGPACLKIVIWSQLCLSLNSDERESCELLNVRPLQNWAGRVASKVVGAREKSCIEIPFTAQRIKAFRFSKIPPVIFRRGLFISVHSLHWWCPCPYANLLLESMKRLVLGKLLNWSIVST